jgi:hypothetical protein
MAAILRVCSGCNALILVGRLAIAIEFSRFSGFGLKPRQRFIKTEIGFCAWLGGTDTPYRVGVQLWRRWERRAEQPKSLLSAVSIG